MGQIRHIAQSAGKRRRSMHRRRFVGPFELDGDSVTRVNVAGGCWNADGLHGYIADWQGNIRAVRRVSDGALIQLTDLTRFATPDPLAALTHGISPYVYCASNPINATDPTGLSVRVYVTNGTLNSSGTDGSHVFMSTGKGENITVYTYGLDRRTGQIAGDGVLSVLTGQRALDYIANAVLIEHAYTVEFPYAEDYDFDAYFQRIFSQGKPTHYPDSRIIDNYHFLTNNCVVTTFRAFRETRTVGYQYLTGHTPYAAYNNLKSLVFQSKTDQYLNRTISSIEFLKSIYRFLDLSSSPIVVEVSEEDIFNEITQ